MPCRVRLSKPEGLRYRAKSGGKIEAQSTCLHGMMGHMGVVGRVVRWAVG
jgi:hypothetical protein